MDTIGARLKSFAKEKFGTLSKMAQAMGISQATLSQYTTNRYSPGVQMQKRLREVGCDIEWLMTGDNSRGRNAAERYWNSLNKEQKEQETHAIVKRRLDTSKGGITMFRGSPAGASSNNPWLDVDPEFVSWSDAMPAVGETYGIKVRGTSMIDAGIKEDDIVVIDTGLVPENFDLVVVAIDGDIVVKRMVLRNGERYLYSENSRMKYPEIKLNGDESIKIVGVVMQVTTPVLRRGRHPLD